MACFAPLPSISHSVLIASKHKKFHVTEHRKPNKKFCAAALRRSNSYESDYKGRAVDEDMIVLRKRIHEMKMMERNYEPPSNWNEWEKQVYTSYDEYICKALGMLQGTLMNTRPSVALGFLALMTMSLPTSAILLALQVMETADKIVLVTGHM